MDIDIKIIFVVETRKALRKDVQDSIGEMFMMRIPRFVLMTDAEFRDL